MADELVFYTNPQSRGRIVRWMLEKVGCEYRTELVDYAAIKDPAYRAVNPMGKVPAIVHHGKIVTEGAAICAYLADAFPEAGLAPRPEDRFSTAAEMRDALEPLAVEILDSVKDALENTPPELAADLTRHGILMAGGGAMLRGFRERLELETGVPVRLADDPLTCVALGAGRAIEEIEVLERAAI